MIRRPPTASSLFGLLLGLLAAVLSGTPGSGEVAVDLAGYSANCGVKVSVGPLEGGSALTIDWPLTEAGTDTGRLVLDLRQGKPLIASMAIEAQGPEGDAG